MIPNVFHLKLVAKSYKIRYKDALRSAKELGISPKRVTNEQAFDIANYKHKPKVEVIIVYRTIEIIPSRMNYTTLEDL